jgi:hypothetical protein
LCTKLSLCAGEKFAPEKKLDIKIKILDSDCFDQLKYKIEKTWDSSMKKRKTLNFKFSVILKSCKGQKEATLIMKINNKQIALFL